MKAPRKKPEYQWKNLRPSSLPSPRRERDAGNAYFFGLGVDKDQAKEIELMKDAAANETSWAQDGLSKRGI